MSVLELLAAIDARPLYPVLFAISLPVVAILLRLLHGRYDGPLAPWKYVYSVLIYLSTIPGMTALLFLLYRVLFLHTDLLAQSIYTSYLPLISAALTLVIMRKSVRFDEIPGFRTLLGLFLLVALSFGVLLLLDRLRVFLFFRASFLSFILIWVAVFFLLRIAVRLIFGKFRH